MKLTLLEVNSEPLVTITSINNVDKFLKDKITHLDREHFVTMCLNPKNQVVGWESTGIGAPNTTAVAFREVFKLAILLNATAIIVAHNHPSGSLEISQGDIKLTKALIEAGKLLSIQVMDHVTVSPKGCLSIMDYIQSKERKKK